MVFPIDNLIDIGYKIINDMAYNEEKKQPYHREIRCLKHYKDNKFKIGVKV